MTENEIHSKLSEVKIDNDNLDYIKMVGEICGKLRYDLVAVFADKSTDNQKAQNILKQMGFENLNSNVWTSDIFGVFLLHPEATPKQLAEFIYQRGKNSK